MECQPNADNACFFEKNHNHINYPRPIRMQGMKMNAASIGVKNRIGEQMIQINKHCCQHQQPGFFPLISIKY